MCRLVKVSVKIAMLLLGVHGSLASSRSEERSCGLRCAASRRWAEAWPSAKSLLCGRGLADPAQDERPVAPRLQVCRRDVQEGRGLGFRDFKNYGRFESEMKSGLLLGGAPGRTGFPLKSTDGPRRSPRSSVRSSSYTSSPSTRSVPLRLREALCQAWQVTGCALSLRSGSPTGTTPSSP